MLALQVSKENIELALKEVGYVEYAPSIESGFAVSTLAGVIILDGTIRTVAQDFSGRLFVVEHCLIGFKNRLEAIEQTDLKLTEYRLALEMAGFRVTKGQQCLKVK